MPYYIAVGIDKHTIDISCPKELAPYEEAHRIKIMELDSLNWYSGMYVLSAVSTAIDRCFNGKKSQLEYIEQPALAEMNLSEEERFERKLKKALAIEEGWAAKAASHLPDNV